MKASAAITNTALTIKALTPRNIMIWFMLFMGLAVYLLNADGTLYPWLVVSMSMLGSVVGGMAREIMQSPVSFCLPYQSARVRTAVVIISVVICSVTPYVVLELSSEYVGGYSAWQFGVLIAFATLVYSIMVISVLNFSANIGMVLFGAMFLMLNTWVGRDFTQSPIPLIEANGLVVMLGGLLSVVLLWFSFDNRNLARKLSSDATGYIAWINFSKSHTESMNWWLKTIEKRDHSDLKNSSRLNAYFLSHLRTTPENSLTKSIFNAFYISFSRINRFEFYTQAFNILLCGSLFLLTMQDSFFRLSKLLLICVVFQLLSALFKLRTPMDPFLPLSRRQLFSGDLGILMFHYFATQLTMFTVYLGFELMQYLLLAGLGIQLDIQEEAFSPKLFLLGGLLLPLLMPLLQIMRNFILVFSFMIFYVLTIMVLLPDMNFLMASLSYPILLLLTIVAWLPSIGLVYDRNFNQDLPS